MAAAPLPPPAPAALGGPPAAPQFAFDWKRSLKWGFTGFILLNVGTNLYANWRAWKEFITLPPAFFLELDLEQQRLVERSSSNPLKLLAAGGREVELHHLIQVLKDAKSDARVRGMLAILGGRENFEGFAQLQELRNALLDFRFHAKGRAPVYAYSNAFGEGGSNGTGLFYLASAADKVFMPPSGMLSLLGFETTQVFVRGLLDRLKVQPQVFRREEYKAALAPLTNTGFDAAHKQNITELLGSMYEQVVEGVASARKLPPAAVQAAINAAPLLPSRAVQLKLLDGLLYRDQVEQQLVRQLPAAMQEAQQQPLQPKRGVPISVAFRSAQLAGPRVPLQRYSIATEWKKNMQQFWGGAAGGSSGGSSSTGSGGGSGGSAAAAVAAGQQPSLHAQQQLSSSSSGQGQPPQQSALSTLVSSMQQSSSAVKPLLPQDKPVVALVTAAGPIMQSNPGSTDPTGERGVESHKLVRVLRGYRDNPQVKAVVLRINSPGGSAVASDMIAREVALLRDGGKPVVACMGDVAASGGYFIAAPCSRILAQPGTITGSIGVISAKLNVQEALLEYGITGDSVALGDNATWASSFHDMTPKQRQQVEGMISCTYSDFLSVVASGRRMSKEAVREVAKGRVWSGNQALEVGLVDELGGVARALDVAKQLAGLPADPDATLTVEYPPRVVPPIVRLLQSAGGMPGSPAEMGASSSSSGGGWTVAASSLGAGLQLASMFIAHAWLPQQQEAESSSSLWSQQQQQQAVLFPPGSMQLPPPHQQQPTAAVGSSAAGVQAQVLALLHHLAQQRQQPEMFCMEAELLTRAC